MRNIPHWLPDSSTYLGLIICLTQCETMKYSELSISSPHSPIPSLFPSSLCFDGTWRAVCFLKIPRRSFLKICLGALNVYSIVRVASCWVSSWQRLMGSNFSTLESGLCATLRDGTRTMELW